MHKHVKFGLSFDCLFSNMLYVKCFLLFIYAVGMGKKVLVGLVLCFFFPFVFLFSTSFAVVTLQEENEF